MAFNYRTEYQRYRQYYVNLRRFYQRPVMKVSFFVLLSFFTVVFFSVLAIRPTVTTIGQLVREIEDKRSINAALDNKLNALDSLQGELVRVQSDIPLIFNVLPDNSALGRLMQSLEYLAQQQGVALVSVRFQPIPVTEGADSKGEKAQTVQFSMSLGGSFSNITAYLNTLERLDRLIVISKVNFISSASNFRGQGFSTVAEVEGQGFFLKEIQRAEESSAS